jgi:hypothetical protein
VERLERLERMFAPREGSLRPSSREYRQFVGIARGSAGEVCYQLLLAKDLQYINEEVYRELRADYETRAVVMAKVRSERDLVDHGIRVEALGYSGAARFLRIFRRAVATTSRFRKSSSRKCVWTRSIFKKASAHYSNKQS